MIYSLQVHDQNGCLQVRQYPGCVKSLLKGFVTDTLGIGYGNNILVITIQRHTHHISRLSRSPREVHPVIIVLAPVFALDNQTNPVFRVSRHVLNSFVGVNFPRHQGSRGIGGLFVPVLHRRLFRTRLFSRRDGNHRVLVCCIRVRDKHTGRLVPFRGDVPGRVVIHQKYLLQLEDFPANLVFHVHTSQHPGQGDGDKIARHDSFHSHLAVHGNRRISRRVHVPFIRVILILGSTEGQGL